MLQCIACEINFFNYFYNFLIQAGFSALHLAAQNGHNESSRVLLYAGLNNDHKNNVSHTIHPD